MLFVSHWPGIFIRGKGEDVGRDPPTSAALAQLINDLFNTTVGIRIIGLIDV
jgi:hypothetical protein